MQSRVSCFTMKKKKKIATASRTEKSERPTQNFYSKERQASSNQSSHCEEEAGSLWGCGSITFLAACSSSTPSPITTYTTFLPNLCIMRSKQLSFPAKKQINKGRKEGHMVRGVRVQKSFVYLAGCMLFILPIANHNICNVSAKAGDYTLKTALFAWRQTNGFHRFFTCCLDGNKTELRVHQGLKRRSGDFHTQTQHHYYPKTDRSHWLIPTPTWCILRGASIQMNITNLVATTTQRANLCLWVMSEVTSPC